jgi:hypothetical protein
MSEAYTTPEELFAEQEAILARIARCQDLLGSAILRARVALGIEPTTRSFFHDQVSWAKRGAVAAPAPARLPKPAPVEIESSIAAPPAPVAVPPPPVTAVAPPPPPPRVGDASEVLAGFTAGTFFRQQVVWTGAARSAPPPSRPSLLDQLVIGQETPALPVSAPPIPVTRPAPPPIDYTMAAGAFFKTVPWQAGQSAAFGTRSGGGNFLAAATESALRAAQRLSTKPAP